MSYKVKVSSNDGFRGSSSSSSSYNGNNNSLNSSKLNSNYYANDDSTDRSIRSIRSIDSKQSYIISESDQPSVLSVTANNTKRVTEAAFRHQNRTNDNIQKYIAPFTNVQALDISYNKLTSLPRSLPSSLIAIDLSYNIFTSFKSFKRVNHLVELRISNNNISSTLGLTNIITLEYLDISYNKITVLEGLETLTNLKVLLLHNNNINDDISVRPLSFNVALEVLTLKDNPLSYLKTYKAIILRLLPHLFRLDDNHFTRKNDKGSYKKMYEDKEKTAYLLNNSNDVLDMRYRGYNDSMVSKSNDKSSIFVYDGSADGSVGPPKPPLNTSAIPWRNPPYPLPRQWKGKALLESVPYSEQLKLKMERVKKTPKTPDTTQWMTPSLATKSKILLDTETVLGHPSDPSERKSPTKLMTTDTSYVSYVNDLNDYENENDNENDYIPQSYTRNKQVNDSNDRGKRPTVPPFVVTRNSSKHITHKNPASQEDVLNISPKSEDAPWHLDTKAALLRAQFVKDHLERESEISKIELSKTVVPTALSIISQSKKGHHDISDTSISLDLVSEAISISEQVDDSISDQYTHHIRKESPYAMLMNLQKKLGYRESTEETEKKYATEISTSTLLVATPRVNSPIKVNSPVLPSSPINNMQLEGKQLADAIKELMQRKQNTIELLQSARKKNFN